MTEEEALDERIDAMETVLDLLNKAVEELKTGITAEKVDDADDAMNEAEAFCQEALKELGGWHRFNAKGGSKS